MTLYDHDLEREVLGVIGDESSLDAVRARLQVEETHLAAEDFHLSSHADVFAVALGLLRAGAAANLVTVQDRAPGLTGELLGKIYAPIRGLAHNLPEHVRRLQDLATRRRAVAAADAVRAAALDSARDVSEVLSLGATAWNALTQTVGGSKGGEADVLALMDDLQAAQDGSLTLCHSSHIDVWDAVLGGLGVGELTFLGSQPGVGKSSVIATIIDEMTSRGEAVGLFSLEDLAKWLPRRLLSRRSSVPLFVLAKRPLTPAQMERAAEPAQAIYNQLRLLQRDERSMLTAPQIVQEARRMARLHGVKRFIIDHLGKVSHNYKLHPGRPDLAIEDSLQHFSAFAKEEKASVLIAAHTKDRDADQRYKRPEPTDFAGSAFIERDARAMVGLYLDKTDPDTLFAAVLKQTNGNGDDTFAIRRLKAAGMVAAMNGKVDTQYDDDERRMLAQRERET